MRFKRNGSYTLNRKSKTKPNGKKPPAEEKKQYVEPEFTKTRVVDFDLKELVVLPREIDLNEWLASNTTTFFNLINLQYSTISEFCTGETCQAMTACSTIYYWYDERGKKTKCTAPQYVDFVMSLCQKLVTDEEIFPTKYGEWTPFCILCGLDRYVIAPCRCRHVMRPLASPSSFLSVRPSIHLLVHQPPPVTLYPSGRLHLSTVLLFSSFFLFLFLSQVPLLNPDICANVSHKLVVNVVLGKYTKMNSGDLASRLT
uniref:MOB kinase activator 2a n=1 Tax=Fundulus heteroclitus TaxID=8078 RepID=A0A3Q2QKK1_FUNHE